MSFIANLFSKEPPGPKPHEVQLREFPLETISVKREDEYSVKYGPAPFPVNTRRVINLGGATLKDARVFSRELVESKYLNRYLAGGTSIVPAIFKGREYRWTSPETLEIFNAGSRLQSFDTMKATVQRAHETKGVLEFRYSKRNGLGGEMRRGIVLEVDENSFLMGSSYGVRRYRYHAMTWVTLELYEQTNVFTPELILELRTLPLAQGAVSLISTLRRLDMKPADKEKSSYWYAQWNGAKEVVEFHEFDRIAEKNKLQDYARLTGVFNGDS